METGMQIRVVISLAAPLRPEKAQVKAQDGDQKRAQVDSASKAQDEAQVEVQVNRHILESCRDRPLSSAEIATALGHKQLSGNLRKALPRLRESGWLEYTIPDKPKSRLQKYRLSAKSRAWLGKQQQEKRTL